MRQFKIASIQTNPICGRVNCNLGRAFKFINRASKNGAKIVCLPELFDTGYDLAWVKKNARQTFGSTKDFLSSLSRDYSYVFQTDLL